MRSRLKSSIRLFGWLGAVVCLAVPSAAQDRGGGGADADQELKKALAEAIGFDDSPPLPPGGPTPRMSDGRPDLTGIWFRGLIGAPSARARNPAQAEPPIAEDPVPLKPEIAAKFKTMTRAQLQAANPTVNCLPRGVPGMFTMNPHPTEIVTTPGSFIQLVEAGNQWRKIHTDKRPHPKYPDPLFNGNSSAWWDGDTLIIDSVGFDTRTWVRNGWPHGENMRVIERLRRPSKNYLEYQFTVEDPEFLTKSWTSGWHTFTLSRVDDRLLENYCTNDQDAEHFRLLADQEKRDNR